MRINYLNVEKYEYHPNAIGCNRNFGFHRENIDLSTTSESFKTEKISNLFIL